MRKSQRLGAGVYRLVNQLKHDVDAGLGQGTSERFRDALKTAEKIGILLEQTVLGR